MAEQWTIEKIKKMRAEIEAPESEFYHADEFVAESHNMIDFLLARIDELETAVRKIEDLAWWEGDSRVEIHEIAESVLR